jgi:hypothetical protein
MTPERLASLAAYAGDRLHPDGPSGPHPFAPENPVRARNAVYVVCAWSGRVLYVGSTTVGVRGRFRQHLADVARTLDWTTAYVIPLTDGTPVTEVRRVEGRIGRATAPARNRALPRIC